MTNFVKLHPPLSEYFNHRRSETLQTSSLTEVTMNSDCCTDCIWVMSVNLASTAAMVGRWAGSSNQHCCMRSTSRESTASTLDPGGTRGRNGGVSPLRTRPTTSAPHTDLINVIPGPHIDSTITNTNNYRLTARLSRVTQRLEIFNQYLQLKGLPSLGPSRQRPSMLIPLKMAQITKRILIAGFHSQIFPFCGGLKPLTIQCYTSVPAKCHLIPSTGYSTMHECDADRETDRRTHHAMVTSAVRDYSQHCQCFLRRTLTTTIIVSITV